MEFITASTVSEFLYPVILPITLLIFSISLWNLYVESTRDSRCDLPLPPGNVGLPFVGETLKLAFKGYKFYTERKARYGRIYKTHILGKPTIRIWGTENIKKILRNEEMLHTMSWPTSVIEILGRGALINSTRRAHTLRRSMLARAFTNKTVNGYSKTTEKLITKWLLDQCNKTDVVQSLNVARKLSFEVAAKVLLGTDITKEQVQTLMTNMEILTSNFFCLPLNIPGTSFHKAMQARTAVLTIIRKLMEQKSGSGEGDDALSHLLMNIKQGNLDQSEVEDSLIESMFSVQNGFPSLCCSILNQLANHPEVTEQLLQELSNADLLDADSHLSAESLKDLPYLERVWKEITRLNPPFGGGFRKVIKTFELEGYQIPEGWTILYAIRDNHQAEENFTAAAEFNPDRWAEPINSSDSLFPFGGNGIRSCPAQNFNKAFFKQFISILVKYSQWEIHDSNPSFKMFPVLLPKSDLPIVFYHRKPQLDI